MRHSDQWRRASAAFGRAGIGGMVLLATVALTADPGPAWTRHAIDPCAPDGAITCDSERPHLVYTPTAPARNELAVFFGGTDSTPGNYDKIGEALADHGYHVINVRYVNNVAVHSLCSNATRLSDPECHRRFRGENMWGQNVPDPAGQAHDSAGVFVSQGDSIANRLLKLVEHLATAAPHAGQGWDQFRDTGAYNATYGAYDLVWSLVAIGGHSQGAGVGLYAGKFHGLKAIGMLAGPQDSWEDKRKIYVANWITEGGFATAPAQMFGFGHEKDAMFARQLAAWTALSLPGALTSVTVGYPYNHSRRLKTASPGTFCAHSYVAEDSCTPSDPPAFAPVWHYMYDADR